MAAGAEAVIFGPIAPIVTFSTEDDAIRLANNTFGLVAYVFTKDLNRGLRVIERPETSMLGLNAGVISSAAAAFGRVKQSGLGRQSGSAGIKEYLYTFRHCSPKNPRPLVGCC